MRSPEAAAARAEKIYATGRYDGVAAYTLTRKPGEEVYGHHQVHARFGDVPDYGSAEQLAARRAQLPMMSSPALPRLWPLAATV